MFLSFFSHFSHWAQKIREWRRGKARNTRSALIEIEISAGALRKNLAELQRMAPKWGVAPVLKSNAYGHGAVLVAKILEKESTAGMARIPFFCLDSYFEAEVLRRAGVKMPLLILGHTPTESIVRNTLRDISFAVASREQLEDLLPRCRNRRCDISLHLKFDTGMHRQGMAYQDAEKIAALFSRDVREKKNIAKKNNVKVEGIFSHFSSAEESDPSVTLLQIERWNTLVKIFQKELPSIKHYHIANSAGLGFAEKIVATAGRSGLALYGFNPGNLADSFHPALSMRSRITEIRTIEAGERVGYNGSFVTERKTRIATVPAGYFEGIDRRLENRGVFLIGGKPARIAGKVSMNISSCVVDEDDFPEVSLGTPVLLISANPDDPNSVRNIARECGTIPYEILVHLPAHLKRAVRE